MRALLSFRLPDEKEEFELAQQAGQLHSIVWNVANYARSLRKYENKESIPTKEVLEKLDELLEGALD
jgi:hypothetical protein